MRDSTIRGLRTFCTAARHLSFKAAAEELCITPSAVSHQIKVLEELVGMQLFDRRTREVVLTEAGELLAGELSPVLNRLDAVVSKFVVSARARRILRITLPPFFASEMFVPRLSQFADQHNTIEIRVETSEAGTMHQVASDASVVLLASPPNDTCAHALFPLSLVPACSPELATALGPTDAASLMEATLIVHKSRPNAWNDWFAQSAQKLADRPHVIYLDSMFAVARAAEEGVGVALVPVPLSNSWFESGALKRISNRELETPDTYYFVYRQDDESNADIQALRDWAIQSFEGVESKSSVG
jgi:LysR family glycine cleavage system transcriptional activator